MSDPQAGEPRTDEDPGSKKRRSPWLWVSLVLLLVAAGLLIWGLNTQSDLDDSQQNADQLQSQLEQGKQTGSAVIEEGKKAYDDLSQELGTTNKDLAETEQELEDAQNQADEAKQAADAAKEDAAKAGNDVDKAKAETEQAQAEAAAAESKAAIAADCARAYLSALGMLFEGESVKAQAEVVKQELESISGTCKASLEGA